MRKNLGERSWREDERGSDSYFLTLQRSIRRRGRRRMVTAVVAASLRRLQLQRRTAATRRRRRGVLGRGLREAESHRKCWLLNSGGGRGALASSTLTHSAAPWWWPGPGSRWTPGSDAGRCAAGRCWPGTRRCRHRPAPAGSQPAHSRRWCRTPCRWRRGACGRRPTAAWRSPLGWSQSTTTGSLAWGFPPRRSTARRCRLWAWSQTGETWRSQLDAHVVVGFN